MRHTDLSRNNSEWDNYPKDDPQQGIDLLLLLLTTLTIVFFAFVGICVTMARNGFWDNI